MPSPAVVLDVFRTLLDFDGDHITDETFGFMAEWFAYRGFFLQPSRLAEQYSLITAAQLRRASSTSPDVDVQDVWHAVLNEFTPEGQNTEDFAWRDRLVTEACLVFRQITTRRLRLWPGTIEFLDALGDVRLAVASNTQRAYTLSELARFGLLQRFEVVVFSSDVRACKPDPTVLTTAMQRLDLSPIEIIYIGDDPFDDVGACAAADVRCILLERGTPVPPGATLLEPFARIAGDDVLGAARTARDALGLP